MLAPPLSPEPETSVTEEQCQSVITSHTTILHHHSQFTDFISHPDDRTPFDTEHSELETLTHHQLL